MFSDESKYIFNDIIFKNITSNSKFLLLFSFNDVVFNNITASDITCIGDGGDTYFITFDSGEKETKNFIIKNSHFQNIISNGSFFKITGDSNIISFQNTTITNVKTYGSVIDNKSKKVIKLIQFFNEIYIIYY